MNLEIGFWTAVKVVLGYFTGVIFAIAFFFVLCFLVYFAIAASEAYYKKKK